MLKFITKYRIIYFRIWRIYFTFSLFDNDYTIGVFLKRIFRGSITIKLLILNIEIYYFKIGKHSICDRCFKVGKTKTITTILGNEVDLCENCMKKEINQY